MKGSRPLQQCIGARRGISHLIGTFMLPPLKRIVLAQGCTLFMVQPIPAVLHGEVATAAVLATEAVEATEAVVETATDV